MANRSLETREPYRDEQGAAFGELAMRSERDRDGHTISLSGELDVDNVGDVEQELMRVEATDAGAIVLDLSEVTFMDSTAIRLLLTADARSREDGRRLALRRPSASVLRVLRLVGIEDRLPFAD
jgi:anti-sigma B factor antagonist